MSTFKHHQPTPGLRPYKPHFLTRQTCRLAEQCGCSRENPWEAGVCSIGCCCTMVAEYMPCFDVRALQSAPVIVQVPDLWKRVSYPSLRPLGSYLSDLYRRLDMLSAWAAAGKPPSVFWLPGFFFAQSFFTAGELLGCGVTKRRSILPSRLPKCWQCLVPAELSNLGIDSCRHAHTLGSAALFGALNACSLETRTFIHIHTIQYVLLLLRDCRPAKLCPQAQHPH